MQDILKVQLTSHFQQLKRNKLAPYFLNPVNPEALDIPDYTDYITYPMDLRTVSSKVQRSAYINKPTDFVTDIRQIFMNAIIYNEPSTEVYSCAIALSNFFETLLEKSNLPKPLPLGFGRSTRWVETALAWKRVKS